MSAVIEPSTAASATTAFAGFLENAALGAYDTHRLCGQYGKGRPLDACIANETGTDAGSVHRKHALHTLQARQSLPATAA